MRLTPLVILLMALAVYLAPSTVSRSFGTDTTSPTPDDQSRKKDTIPRLNDKTKEREKASPEEGKSGKKKLPNISYRPIEPEGDWYFFKRGNITVRFAKGYELLPPKERYFFTNALSDVWQAVGAIEVDLGPFDPGFDLAYVSGIIVETPQGKGTVGAWIDLEAKPPKVFMKYEQAFPHVLQTVLTQYRLLQLKQEPHPLLMAGLEEFYLRKRVLNADHLASAAKIAPVADFKDIERPDEDSPTFQQEFREFQLKLSMNGWRYIVYFTHVKDMPLRRVLQVTEKDLPPMDTVMKALGEHTGKKGVQPRILPDLE